MNFFQHLNYNYIGIKGDYKEIYFDRYIRNYFAWLESETGIEISTLGTGSKNGERVLKNK